MKRLNSTRKAATGVEAESSGSSSDGVSSGDESDKSEEEDVDEKITMEKFKDQCWTDLTSSSLTDDIAKLTGAGEAKAEEGDNIIVGFRIRPPRAVESVDDEPAVSARGQEVRISKPTMSGSREKHTFAYDYTFGT